MKLILVSFLFFINANIYGQKPVIINEKTLDSIAPYVQLVETTWIFASESHDNKKFYIRNSYISKNDNEIKIWVKIIYPKYTFNKKVYKDAYKLTLCIFDYVDRKMKVTSETNYAAKGKVITPFNTGAEEWSDIIPESVFEGVYNKVLETFVN